MKAIFSLSALAALLPLGTAAAIAKRATPTVYFCGDSTMANLGANGDTDGWGQYISKYLSGVSVVNKAISGRSARSYYNEGRFDAVAALVTTGDIVVIEFGHNDGGSPESSDNGRSDCYGAGEETCISDADGSTVYTFVYYVIQGAKKMLAKGATVILSSQTPNNPWENGVWTGDAAPGRFVGYAKTAASALASSSVTFVDHHQATMDTYRKLGDAATNALYPNDHTHTSPAGANYVAEAFAQAIATKMNGTTSLAGYVVSPYPVVY